MSFRQVYAHNIENAIRAYGKDIIIYYSSTTNPYAGAYDPVYKEPITLDYATSLAPSSYPVKAVVHSFLGNMNFYDYTLAKQGYVPEADIRITCWLSDVLMNCASVSGPTYLDKSKKVYYEGKYYTVKKTYKTGFERPTVIIATLDEIKDYPYVH
jgi:hypothetical protein